ncbi:MAG: MFS transporter [Actinobacteria bacterium]|nr:MFS transporter [Actinomycetota bacterium]
MEELSAGRRRGALAALALGGFAIGLTEFALMGLLPEVAHGLLPGTWARSSPLAVAHAGWLITAYALGVVVGAPTIAAVSARVPRKRLVAGLLGLFVVATALTAVAPTFGLVLAARFVAGLPHGAYFGAAGMVAASLLGPGNRAKGYAVVLGGLTVATVAGVPLVTALGQATSWRVAYLVIAALFALATAAVLATVPAGRAGPGGSPRAELRAFRTPQVWLVALIGTIGFAGFFAAYSFIAPVTTAVAGLPASAVPWVLVAAGVGMTAGNLLGGLAADRGLRRAMLGGFAALIVASAAYATLARSPAGLLGCAFVVGLAALFLAPALQTRLIEVAPGAQLMGAAVNQSATNLANSIGAALGSLAIGQGLGYLSPAWIGVGLGAVGLVLAAVSFRLDRRRPVAEGTEPAGAVARDGAASVAGRDR